MAGLTGFLKALFITGPAVPNGAYRNQGFSRATELFSEVKPEHPPGLLAKGIRLLILWANYVRPQVWLDTAFDWLWYASGRGRREGEISTWREIYYLARLAFFFVSLFLWHGTALVWIVVFLLGDMLLQLAGDVLVWGKYAINPQRTLLLSVMNYAELTVAFAVFYANCDCLDKAPSPVQALYLSAVTATTLGYLPKGAAEPNSSRGLVLVIGQLAVFVVFVLLFVNTFLSRAAQSFVDTARREGQPNSGLQRTTHGRRPQACPLYAQSLLSDNLKKLTRNIKTWGRWKGLRVYTCLHPA